MTPTEITADKAKKVKKPPAAWLFFQRWMANPLSMGSVTPSGPGLRRLIRENLVCGPNEIIVEFGAGTGAITRALLDSGVSGDRIYSFEIDPQLASYVRGVFPDVNVLNEDCRNVEKVLGPDLSSRVGTVVIGIPMVTLPMTVQQEIVDATVRVLPKGRRFILYTYMIHSPLNRDALNIKGHRVGWTVGNIPPASVWAYWRD